MAVVTCIISMSKPVTAQIDPPAESPGGLFGERTELVLAIASGVFAFGGLALDLLTELPFAIPLVSYVLGLICGGYYTVIEAYHSLARREFDIDFLMLVAAIGAAVLGAWFEGALLLFLFSLGHALEHYAMNRARKSIAALAELAPPTATVRRDGALVEVAVEALRIDDLIVVRPNTKIAADGVVEEGRSSVNQAPITGESVPVDKRPVPAALRDYELNKLPAEHRVFAGTINGAGALEVRVRKLAKDSTLARLVQLVQEAESQKSPTQHFADRFERVFVPMVLILVTVLLFAFLIIDEPFSASFYRAMAVLVAASPCALAISTPSAILAGVARAARAGVLIKGGRPLESLGEIEALAFDKTGTLTAGRPVLTEVIPAAGVTEAELLRIAVAIENLSDHPLAAAVVTGGTDRLRGAVLPEADELEALTARGIKASVENHWAYLGNRRLFEELTGTAVPAALSDQMRELESAGHTVMIAYHADHYLGLIAVRDEARAEARTTMDKLRGMGIRRMIMLTGDNQRVADAIGAELGITDPLGDLLPEDKVAAIERLRREEGEVAMVGDGVNDAPAMAKSTLGIAMGAAGSDVALETADIALMADRLDRLPFAIALSRQTNRIIKQNIWISLGMVAVLVPLTILGIAPIGPAVVAHEGSTLVVVLNALRLLGFRE
jgi:Cd2+/Zn2+-exporting ATPase